MGLYDTFGKATKPDSNPGVRPMELYMCSVVKRMGYADGESRGQKGKRAKSQKIKGREENQERREHKRMTWVEG